MCADVLSVEPHFANFANGTEFHKHLLTADIFPPEAVLVHAVSGFRGIILILQVTNKESGFSMVSGSTGIDSPSTAAVMPKRQPSFNKMISLMISSSYQPVTVRSLIRDSGESDAIWVVPSEKWRTARS